ncbi:EAL domain-containing protein [Fundidesulfovibrio magnetotacticus]|nr:EAL domain-containing protein [Fundidesulfovibrio magnetotacticus]
MHAFISNANAQGGFHNSPTLYCPLYELADETVAAVELSPAVLRSRLLPGFSHAKALLRGEHALFAKDAFACVRLGTRELADREAPARLLRAVRDMDQDAARFCLFFSDSLCKALGFRTIEQLMSFKRSGFRLGIDIDSLDAAAGPFLEMLPADVLRLGALDTVALTSDPDGAAELASFTHFADNLLMIPAASGVRNRAQLSMLRQTGMRFGQGPLFPPHSERLAIV